MSIDAKRDEYRKYLERTGAMDALTKVLVALYEESEKPEDSVAYIKRNLGGAHDEGLEEQLAAANQRIKELEDKLAQSGGATPASEKAASSAGEVPAEAKDDALEKPPEEEKVAESEPETTDEAKETEADAEEKTG